MSAGEVWEIDIEQVRQDFMDEFQGAMGVEQNVDDAAACEYWLRWAMSIIQSARVQ